MVESTAGQGDDVVNLVTIGAVLVDFFYLDKVRITWYTKTGTIRVSGSVLVRTKLRFVFSSCVSFTSGDGLTSFTLPVRTYLSVSILL